jgi:hypothetical protein
MKKILLLTVFVFCPIFLPAQQSGSIVNQVNADFSQGEQGWYLWTNQTGKGEFAVVNGRGQVKIIEPGPLMWSIGIANPGINIEKGRMYKVEFEARANPPISVNSLVQMNREPWTAYSGEKDFKLTENNEKYSYTFTMRHNTDHNAAFEFQFGGQKKSTITFGNVRITDLGGSEPAEGLTKNVTVKIARAVGTPISPFAFGNNYFDWVDWNRDGMVGLLGTEEAVRALRLNLLPGDINMNDDNIAQLFDKAQMDKYIQYCRAVGAEPVMIVPVYGNNVDRGPTSAKGAADIVTYINGTKKYGVKYWCIGFEVDIYDQYYKTNYPVSNASQYAAIFKSYAQAMKDANAAANSGVDLKFMTELGWRYSEENDWLSPLLDECKDYIDIVSIHAYGFPAHNLSVDGALYDIDQFPGFIQDMKARVARHARPGTPLAITEANICYEWDTKLYTPQTRKVGPGTFYAAIWDADRMGAALEAGLWNFSFWELAEPVQSTNSTVFGFILTEPLKNPPTCKFTPEYYAQQMFNMNFSGTTVVPSGVPDRMSVYASYDAKKAATAILVVNKDTLERVLTLAVDNLKPRTIKFSPMSINIVTIPDDDTAEYHVLEYTLKMADAGLPPRAAR